MSMLLSAFIGSHGIHYLYHDLDDMLCFPVHLGARRQGQAVVVAAAAVAVVAAAAAAS